MTSLFTRKNTIYPLFVGALTLFALSGARRATTLALDPSAIDRFITSQMAVQRVPGLAIAITQGEQLVYVKGFGTAGEGQPVTPQTQFFIASLSKSFTALAVMQLVEAGKIDLDAPVQTYLPEFTLADPIPASQITVRQLLNQTSGLADAGFPEMRLPQPGSPAERVASLGTARSVAEPGVKYQYHNVNYQILARMIEVVSGQHFSDYLQTNIFVPLGMTDTISALTSSEAFERADKLARGHLNAFGVLIPAAEENGYLGGSGGVISTAEDMVRYLVMQANDGRYAGTQLLSPAGIARMHTPPKNIDSSYAMGWIAMTEDGVPVLEHNGILSTFYADMLLLPENGYGIALLYNTHSFAHASLGFPQIKRELVALLNGKQPPAGQWSVSRLEIIFGILTLAGVALAIRSLLRIARWAEKARETPTWRLVPGIVWAFVPAAVILAMPTLVLRTSGRAFGYWTLFRSMLEVTTWLGLTGALGVINGIARIAVLVRRAGNRI